MINNKKMNKYDDKGKNKSAGGKVHIYDYIIVGSGVSGLYFASLLCKKTDNFIILEKKGRIGGRIKTVSYDCFFMMLVRQEYHIIIKTR